MGNEILNFLEVGIVLIIGALIGIYLERDFRKFYLKNNTMEETKK